jgi:hypothetical protein
LNDLGMLTSAQAISNSQSLIASIKNRIYH